MLGLFYMLFTNETDCAQWGKNVFLHRPFFKMTLFTAVIGITVELWYCCFRLSHHQNNTVRREPHISARIRPSLIE